MQTTLRRRVERVVLLGDDLPQLQAFDVVSQSRPVEVLMPGRGSVRFSGRREKVVIVAAGVDTRDETTETIDRLRTQLSSAASAVESRMPRIVLMLRFRDLLTADRRAAHRVGRIIRARLAASEPTITVRILGTSGSLPSRLLGAARRALHS